MIFKFGAPHERTILIGPSFVSRSYIGQNIPEWRHAMKFKRLNMVDFMQGPQHVSVNQCKIKVTQTSISFCLIFW